MRAGQSQQNPTTRRSTLCLSVAICAVIILFFGSLFVGKYPLTIGGIFHEGVEQRVFLNLRLPRSMVALFGGFSLGIAGFVFQTLFKNKLASPDIIGISSGASVGAAVAILFFTSSMVMVTISAFVGALLSLCITVVVMSCVPQKNKANIVLVGIAIQALAQMAIMCLKMMADPERELASIEYWIMGSLNGVQRSDLILIVPATILCSGALFALFRQIMLLSLSDTEGRMLGVSVDGMRWLILLISTLMVASVICVTGLISFVSLLAAHIARLIIKQNNRFSFLLSGVMGAMLLLLADLFARGIYTSELPISIFTSLLGAPFLIYLLVRRSLSNASM